MKKIITIGVLAITLFSCTQNSKELETEDCRCGIVTEVRVVDVLQSDGLHKVSIIKVQNDCTGEITDSEVYGVQVLGFKICNY